jgi:hypothetical protein
MSRHLGDFDASAIVYGKFTTYRPSTGAPFTLAGTPALSVYKDGSTTQSTAGVTLTADFDSVTGLNHFAIDTSADGSFYAAGSFFDVVITTGTVDSISSVGSVVGSFTIRKVSTLKPTTAGRTLDVSAGGEAGVDWSNVGSPTTSLALTGTTISTSQVAASVTAGVSVGAGGIVAGSFAAGAIDAGAIATDAIGSNEISAAAVTKIQTGLATPTNITAGTITTATNLTNLPTIPANWLTAAGLATDAVTEIQTGLATSATQTSQGATLATIAGYIDTEVAAIKAKTDNLPASPAATGDAMTLTSGERTSIADATLGRSVATVEATAAEWSLASLILAALESSISGTTWTIKRTDGTTLHLTKTVATNAAADPITGVS